MLCVLPPNLWADCQSARPPRLFALEAFGRGDNILVLGRNLAAAFESKCKRCCQPNAIVRGAVIQRQVHMEPRLVQFNCQ